MISIFYLGLSSELYYVRDGVVNTYAMNFEVPVPANIGELEFCWQSLTRHSVSNIIFVIILNTRYLFIACVKSIFSFSINITNYNGAFLFLKGVKKSLTDNKSQILLCYGRLTV